jgi:hypothetical protein
VLWWVVVVVVALGLGEIQLILFHRVVVVVVVE